MSAPRRLRRGLGIGKQDEAREIRDLVPTEIVLTDKPSAKRILHSTGISDIRIYQENKKTLPLNVSGLVTRAKRERRLLLITD